MLDRADDRSAGRGQVVSLVVSAISKRQDDAVDAGRGAGRRSRARWRKLIGRPTRRRCRHRVTAGVALSPTDVERAARIARRRARSRSDQGRQLGASAATSTTASNGSSWSWTAQSDHRRRRCVQRHAAATTRQLCRGELTLRYGWMRRRWSASAGWLGRSRTSCTRRGWRGTFTALPRLPVAHLHDRGVIRGARAPRSLPNKQRTARDGGGVIGR